MIQSINYSRLSRIESDLNIAEQIAQMSLIKTQKKGQEIQASLKYLEVLKCVTLLLQEWDEEEPFEHFLEAKIQEAKNHLQKAMDS